MVGVGVVFGVVFGVAIVRGVGRAVVVVDSIRSSNNLDIVDEGRMRGDW